MAALNLVQSNVRSGILCFLYEHLGLDWQAFVIHSYQIPNMQPYLARVSILAILCEWL